MAEIVDGKGQGFRAGVDKDNRVLTYSSTASDVHHINVEHQQVFSWNASALAVVATNFVFFLRNDHDELTIHLYALGASQAAAPATAPLIELLEVTGTPVAGTAVVAKNNNLSSGLVDDADAQSGIAITGLTASGIALALFRVPSAGSILQPLPGHIIIPPARAVGIRATTGVALTLDVALYGYFGTF